MFDHETNRLLRELIAITRRIQQDTNQAMEAEQYTARAIRELLIISRDQLQVQQDSLGFLAQIAKILTPTFPTAFTVKETTMALQQPDPGATLQFTATPQPAGSSLGSVIPTWSADDTTNVTITPDPTGLIASVVLSPSIPVGQVVTLTISATDPTTGNVATGTATFTVGAPPPTFPTSFGVVQTA